jgi:hypothetical protein
MKIPPAVAATEGTCIAVRANAGPSYAGSGAAGKQKAGCSSGPPVDAPRFGGCGPGECAVSPREGVRHPEPSQAAFRAPTGQIWRYSGKRARVLAMLAGGSGLTQWDTLPWHTRLGGTIHAMRRDGLVIDTIREGEYRHARYWLRTPGAVLITGKKRRPADSFEERGQ